MRILMITDFYWPYLGGVEQHVRTLSQSLQQRGHAVTVATLWGDGLDADDADDGVRIRRLRSSTQRVRGLHRTPERTWAPPLPDPAITAGLQRIMSDFMPDIVHGHDWLARSYVPLKSFHAAPLVMSLHYYTLSCAKKNLMVGDAPCSGPGLAKCLHCSAQHYGAVKGMGVASVNWMMSRWERATVDCYLAVSDATAAGNGLNVTRQQVIPNFLVSTPSTDVEALEPYLRQLPSGDFMLFVGDLRPIKGVDVMLAAYGALDNPLPLVMIGKVWPDTPQTLPPNVFTFRNWPNAAVREAWQRSSIALAPSIWAEPFGIVVIEAMAGGTPVIASRVGGIPEIVVDGESGILVPPGDKEALRAAMSKLLTDVPLRTRMGQAARQRAARYDAAAVVPQVEEIYARVLAN